MSELIYKGAWINWAHGPVAGATLTLAEREGGLLIAFIAFFVTLIAAQLFKILTFTFHQLRTRRSAQDALYHQQQVIFRNSSTPVGAAWNFLQQSWTWNSRAKRSFLRTIPWALFCLSYMVLFAAAAIFSSEITKSTGSARLVVSANDGCGYWQTGSDYTSPDAIKAYSGRLSNQSLANTAYARECYGGAPNRLTCNKMQRQALPTKINVNASCPFADGMCEWGDNAAFEIRSELIDSLHDLGINTRAKDRLQFQKVATCSPLIKKGFIETKLGGTSSGFGIPGDGIYMYMYGPSVATGGFLNLTDYTFVYNNHTRMDGNGYKVSAGFHTAGTDPTSSGWKPIDELNRTDADVNIMFLSQNNIAYAEKVDDPMFSAHIPADLSLAVSGMTYYMADWFVNIMACTDQYQVCNPNNDQCTGLQGVNQILPWIAYNNDKLDLNEMQQAISIRMMRHAFESSIHSTVFAQAENGLLAKESLVDTLSQGLPINQWHLEVENYFHEGLAHIQLATVEYAAGPPISPGAELYQPWKDISQTYGISTLDIEGERMCHAQMINDASDSISFSIVGMIVLFGFGGLIILIATFIDSLVGFFQRRFGVGMHARMCWLLDDKLHLHRSVNEKLGHGHWNEDFEAMPSTIVPQEFVSLAVAERKVTGDEKPVLVSSPSPSPPPSASWPLQTTVGQAAPAYQGVGHPGRGYAQVVNSEELWLTK